MIPQLPRRSVISRRQVLASAVVPIVASAGSAQAQGEKNGAIIVWPELKLLSGATLRTDDWSNMPAIIVFWETWCPYCKRQNAHVDQLYQATLRQKMRVIGVTTEKNEAKVKAYMQSNQFSFPVALIDTEFRSQFTKRVIVPLTCLVSASGRLMQVIPGEMSNEDVLSLESVLLGGSGSKIGVLSDS